VPPDLPGHVDTVVGVVPLFDQGFQLGVAHVRIAGAAWRLWWA
jgi:hypothetical protein